MQTPEAELMQRSELYTTQKHKDVGCRGKQRSKPEMSPIKQTNVKRERCPTLQKSMQCQ